MLALVNNFNNIESLNSSVINAVINNNEAKEARKKWIRWYDTLSWWEKCFEESILKEAELRFKEFNDANTNHTLGSREGSVDLRSLPITKKE